MTTDAVLITNPIKKEGVVMEHMKERLGSWQIGSDRDKGKVEFRLFFPSESTGLEHNIKTIQVVGDFQKTLGNPSNWDPTTAPMLSRTPHSEGEIWSWTTPKELHKGFYQYKYYVTFNDPAEPPRWVSDPFTRYGGKDNMNAAIVVGGSSPEENYIEPLAGGRKPLRDLVIYEMMIDDFTLEYRKERAPLDAVCDKLDYLVEIGFNAILFMPWTAWNNDLFRAC
jgi:1,4-alpha-glucan branching enzyme